MAESTPNSAHRSAKSFNVAETRFQGRYASSLLNTLYQAYRPMMGRTLFFLALGLVGRLALLGNANLIGYWADSFCAPPAHCHELPGWLSGYGTRDFLRLLLWATSAGFALTVAYRVGISRLSVEAVSKIYDETTLRTSRLPMAFFDRNPAGRVMTRFSSDYNNAFRIFGGPLSEFIGLIFEMLAMTVLIGLASPLFLPFWGIQFALNFAVYRRHLPRLRLERREVAAKRSPGIAHFAETAGGASTIRAFGRQGAFERRFAELNDSYLDQRLRAMTAFVGFSLSMSVVTAFSFLVTGIASAWLAYTGRLSVGSIGVAFAYLGLSSNILQSFFEWLGQFEEALTGLERMNEYLRAPLEPGAKLPAAAAFDTGHPRESMGDSQSAPEAGWARAVGGTARDGASIEVKDLWMRYRDDLPPVLQGIDLTIAPGERLAVVGKTGSGKTSFVQALFRLYPIERGRIRIGGCQAEVRSGARAEGANAERAGEFVDLREYRRLLSYITQEATLFLGTLRENLSAPSAQQPVKGAAASPEALASDDARLVQALKRVQFLSPGASDEKYRHWLDYPIEERGRNLSAGERQLVCMARCLLQDSPVVILDEATSAVDPESEEILTRATEEFFKGKTQILIAHRLSSVRGCDRVLWLQHGRVHRLGTPAEVLPEFERAELDV